MKFQHICDQQKHTLPTFMLTTGLINVNQQGTETQTTSLKLMCSQRENRHKRRKTRTLDPGNGWQVLDILIWILKTFFRYLNKGKQIFFFSLFTQTNQILCGSWAPPALSCSCCQRSKSKILLICQFMTHYYRAHKFLRGQRLKTCALLQYIYFFKFKFYTALHQIFQSSSSSSLLTTQNSWRESGGAVSERCSEQSLVSSWAAFTRRCQLLLPRCLTLKDWKHSLHVKLTVSLLSCMYPINDLQNRVKCTERGWGREAAGGCVWCFVLHMHVYLRARVSESTEVC